MNHHGRIVAVCVSERTGIPKKPVEQATLKVGWGIEGDAHAGDWHRQVSLLAMESIDKMRNAGLNVNPGSFAENITTEGIELYSLPIGTELKLGDARARVTQIGKVCHVRCAIYRLAGDCVMPREGIFVEVTEPGTVQAGDEITILSIPEDAPTDPMSRFESEISQVIAVSRSEKRGTTKHEVPQIELKENWGVVGDAHAGHWHRQVSLLAWEDVMEGQARGLEVGPGSFAENIATLGIALHELPIGAKLRIGESLLEVTQIGKAADEPDVIHKIVGDSVIPRKGIFARVIGGGTIRSGDPVQVVEPEDEAI